MIKQLQDKYNLPAKQEAGHSTQADPNAFLLNFNGALFTVAYVNEHIPEGGLDEALAKVRLWPNAHEAANAHKAHYIVASLDAGADVAERRQAASFITFVCAALADLTTVLAINWTNAQTIVPGSAPSSAAKGLIEDGSLPTPIWVNNLFFGDPPTKKREQKLGLITQGLIDFVGRELEFVPEVLDFHTLIARSINIADYLIHKGPVFADGDTFGASETENMKVEHAIVSSTKTPVYRLTLMPSGGA